MPRPSRWQQASPAKRRRIMEETMPFYKHCCHSLITEDHTDHCLSTQAEMAELEQQRDAAAAARAELAAENARLTAERDALLDAIDQEINATEALGRGPYTQGRIDALDWVRERIPDTRATSKRPS